MPRKRTTLLTISIAVAATIALGVDVPGAHAAPAGSRTTSCHGEGVDPSARIRYSSDIVIDAPLSTVWKLQTDIERWPSWQAAVLTAERLDPGSLRKGSGFRWTTPAPVGTLDVTSTVRQLLPGRCVLWSGPAVGEEFGVDNGTHLWTFEKTGRGVRVHTEETWTGAQVETEIPAATAALGASLEAWLHDLKAAAEVDWSDGNPGAVN